MGAVSLLMWIDLSLVELNKVMCVMVKTPRIGYGHPIPNRDPHSSWSCKSNHQSDSIGCSLQRSSCSYDWQAVALPRCYAVRFLPLTSSISSWLGGFQCDNFHQGELWTSIMAGTLLAATIQRPPSTMYSRASLRNVPRPPWTRP